MKRKNNRKKTTIILSFWLVLILVAFSLYFFVYQKDIFNLRSGSTSETGINLDKPTHEQTQAGNDAKKATIDKSKENQNNEEGQKAQTSIILSSSNVTEGILRLRTLIDAITEGACTLTLSANNTTITKETPIQPLPNGSTCQGFDIPVTELSESNSWDIVITLASPTYTGQLSQKINIQEG